MHFQLHVGKSSQRQPDDPDWQCALPAEWRTAAIVPQDFSIHQEYEMPASRIFGYDADGQPCYYRHTFVLGASRSDDDEEFYEAVIYGEEVEAWRLRDERWLVWRVVRHDEHCSAPRGFYSFSESMPR